MPIFCKIISRLYKPHCSHIHILSEKQIFSQKQGTLMSFCFNFFMKIPCCDFHIWFKQCQFYQNLTIFWAKKVNKIPFSPIFYKKVSAVMPIFCQKNVHSLKKPTLSCPYFVKKMSILSKTPCTYVIFWKFSWKTPCCYPKIWSKNINYVKTTLYHGPKKSIGYTFFPIFKK